ncbi:MAG: hypothetical protein FJ125_16300, partial [Deltaproteobacteria bacterium]|nr:hypothetical protein [Deltaproteobacteria bacterium]
MQSKALAALAALCGLFAGCGGPAANLAINWNDHRTVRTCPGSITGYTGPGEPICSGYMCSN